MLESFANFLQNTGLYALISSGGIDAVKTIIMIAIACVLLYLAIVKKFEPSCVNGKEPRLTVLMCAKKQD